MNSLAPASTMPSRLSPLSRPVASRSYWSLAWQRFRRNRIAFASLIVLMVLTVAAILAPTLAPYSPDAISLSPDTLLLPMSWEHPLGTDELGRDTFSRILYGARVSLGVGFVAAIVSIGIGVMIGATAGMLGGWIDATLMRLVDILLSLPLFFILMIAQTLLPTGILTIMIIIGLITWMDVARLCRAEFMQLRLREYTMAAHVVGASHWRIAWRHLLPNASGPIIVAGTLRVAEAILIESTLSFIGLGIQPPNASLGSMLQKGLTRLLDAPWLVAAPGVAIAITALVFNFIGDGIRDSLDVRQRR